MSVRLDQLIKKRVCRTCKKEIKGPNYFFCKDCHHRVTQQYADYNIGIADIGSGNRRRSKNGAWVSINWE